MVLHYTVILEPEPEGGYSVHCPALPGCAAQGESTSEALANISQAILEAVGAWAEDATHMRLREVSLSYVLPYAWLSRFSVAKASVTLTGRNLAIWKKSFTSWDPEIATQSGLEGDASAYNFIQLGQPRIFTFRVNFGF